MTLTLEMIWSYDQPVVKVHQNLDSQVGLGLGHEFRFTGINLICYVQAEQEDHELENSVPHQNSQKAPIPQITGDVPVSILQTEGNEPSCWVMNQTDFNQHQHLSLIWLNKAVEMTEVYY